MSDQDLSPKKPKNELSWVFLGTLSVCAIAILYLLMTQGVFLVRWASGHLPLLLPLVVTLLSVLTRAMELKDIESVLKISNDLAIGIISFDIWALVAKESNPLGYVLVNQTTIISGDAVMPYFLIGILVAVGCVVISHYPYPPHNYKNHKKRWLLIGLFVSVVVYLMPFGALEPIPTIAKQGTLDLNKKNYIVVIPYQDPNITKIAPGILRNRYFAHIEKIDSDSPLSAQKIVLGNFTNGTESNILDLHRKSTDPKEKVEIDQSRIITFPSTLSNN